jgi:hypothetical protein
MVTWRSSMASSSAGCALAGPQLIFIGQDEVAEDRTLLENEFTASDPPVVDLGAGDVAWEKIRRELNARKLTLQILCKRLNCARLGESRQPSMRRCPFASSAMSNRSTTVSWPMTAAPMRCLRSRIWFGLVLNLPFSFASIVFVVVHRSAIRTEGHKGSKDR